MLTHAIFLETLKSKAADRVKEKLIRLQKHRREKYERAYAMVTQSMKQCRPYYPWIPVKLHDRSFVGTRHSHV